MAENNKGAGRPTKPQPTSETPEAKARANLQYGLDRAAAAIVDAPTTSYVARAGRAARKGVPQEVVEAGLDAMQSALQDAREQVAKIYAAPEKKRAEIKPRANLQG